MYAVSEVPWVASGSSLFLFDPSARYIASSIATDSDTEAAAPMPLGRVYPLVPA